MKLVQYNQKDQSTGSELDLGEISCEVEGIIANILNWMGEVKIFDRYNSAVLCSSFTRTHSTNEDEFYFSEIEFN